MEKKDKKIARKGQAYVAPRAKSLRIANQGVLCSSGASGTTNFKFGMGHTTLG